MDNQISEFTASDERSRTGIYVQAKREQPVPPVTANTVSRNFIFNSSPGPQYDDRFAFEIGIAVSGGGDVVERNVTEGNSTGISVNATSPSVVRNHAVNSDQAAILLCNSGGEVVHNDVRDDRGTDAGIIGILIRNCGLDPMLVERNTAKGFSSDGIDVEAPSVVAKNRADFNGNYGIEAVPGVVDGGGNKAKGNANPLQCVNVFCK